MNLTFRILAEHLVEGELRAGEEIRVNPDQILIEDATGTMTCLQFEKLGVERVAVPLAVLYVDHNVLGMDNRNMDEHRFLQTFSARFGLSYSRPGNGISHYVHLERFARPGHLLVGADSHTTMAGALGMFAVGAGGLDVAVAMAGRGFSISCPSVVAVELRGRFPEWLEAKDIVLELLRRYGVRGGYGRVFEFIGDGVETLSVMERGTICNMALETGATTALFPGDERAREWLAVQAREDEFVALSANPDAFYDAVEVIDLSTLEPLIALPHSPGNVVPVREVEGTKVGQVCVGSSVNSSYEDLARTASILRGGIVHPGVEMTVSPGSRQILDTIATTGVYRDLVAAGARVLEAVCGPCVGVGQAPSAGVPSIRTFNRNFPGRSGTAGDEVYLCSPSTASATALRGEITDPRRLGELPEITPPVYEPSIVDQHIALPPSPQESRTVEVVRGGSILPPPEPQPVAREIKGSVLIVLGDDVSTGDMAPDGALGMSLWSSIPECAKYMFRRQDSEFHDRARSRGGGVIMAGHNYGQGSSREHAALSALHLGVRAVVAKSFARIHRQNLIAQGIVPLLFAREQDADIVRLGDTCTIEDVRDGIRTGAPRLICRIGERGSIEVRTDMLPRERETLVAGGTLRYLRASQEELA